MRKLLRYSALILGTCIALSAIGLFIVTRDEAPPDIADLVPRPLTVPSDKNAFLLLQKLAVEFGALPKDENYIETLTRLSSETTWTTDDAMHIIRPESFAWSSFDSITGISQSDAAFSTETKLTSYTSDLNRLWEAALIRVKLTARTNGPDEALALALNTQSKALIITNAGGTMIDTLIGIGLYATAHETLVALLTSTPSSSESLRQAIARLEEDRMSAASFADSFKTAYRRMPAEIEKMRHQDVADEWLDLPASATWLYKPNQTSRILAGYIRGFIQAIDQPYPESSKFLPKAESPFLFAKVPTPDNAFGKSYAEAVLSYASVLKSRLRVQTSISVTQAWIAATLFERVNGRLPDSLDQLVPEYFPAVPRDYFTGGAIHYSAAARAVWSAGETDLVLTSSDQTIPPRAIALKLKTPPTTQ